MRAVIDDDRFVSALVASDDAATPAPSLDPPPPPSYAYPPSHHAPRMRFSLLVATAAVLAACSRDTTPAKPAELPPPPPPPPLAAGEAMLAVPGGSIWYKVSGAGKGIPVVLVHGGPGFTSHYLKPFEDLGNDRIVVRYDQLGSGKSGKTTDTALFNIPHFVKELDLLRAHLGYDKWHVLGHSWGTMLAMEYYRAYPQRVASLTLGGAVLDVPAYAKHARELLKTLPDSLQQVVAKAEAAHKYDGKDYEAAIDAFYALYLYRHPVKADLDSTFAMMNPAIYNYMQGPSEFTITGTFKDYSATAFLPQVKVPTLFTVGEFDEVGPALVKSFADKVPKARYALLKGAAHIATWDARDENVKVVRDFLRAADDTSTAPRP